MADSLQDLFGIDAPGDGDLVSLWAGQAAGLSSRDDAAEVFAELAAGLPG